MESVNYHTLVDFRSSHKESPDLLFVGVLAIMSAQGLITLERVTRDGPKVKALAGATASGEKSGSGGTYSGFLRRKKKTWRGGRERTPDNH